MPNRRVSNNLAVKLEQAGMALQRAPRDAVMRASMVLKTNIEGKLEKAVGADRRMSNLRKKPGQQPPLMSVGFNIKGTTNPTSLLFARGPWGLVEYGAMPHAISTRVSTSTGSGKGISRANRNRMIRQRQLDITYGAIGVYAGLSPMNMGGIYRYRVMHPGTPGKLPFHRGMEQSKERAIKELYTTVSNTVVDVIRSGRQVWVYAKDETGVYT
jgi:hypothetical protein